MSEPAPEQRTPTRRPLLLAAVVVGVAGATLVGFTAGGETSAPAAPGAPLAADFDRDRAGQRTLDGLGAALEEGDRAGYLVSWGAASGPQAQAAELFDNLAALEASATMRVVGSHDLTSGQAGVPTPAWASDVRLRWRLDGVAHTAARARLSVSFTVDDGATRVLDVSAEPGTTTPIWLTGPLTVVRGEGSVVAAATEEWANRLSRQVEVARAQVARTVGATSDTSIAYLPADADAFEAVVRGEPGEHANIAGVAAFVDARARHLRLIVMNPEHYDEMDAPGQQFVVSHEWTHVALGSPDGLPTWLDEGLADFAAFRYSGLAVDDVAGAALAAVREEGSPARLPTERAFTTSSTDLSVTYEFSWLAVRMLAQQHGADQVVALCEDLRPGPGGLNRDLRSTWHTSLAQVTEDWRTYLEALADAA